MFRAIRCFPLFIAVLALVALNSCGGDEDPLIGVSHSGTVQGVVVNALTGEPVDVGLSVSIQVNGKLKNADVLTIADDVNPVTQYGFLSVPADVELPIVVSHPQYQAFEGTIALESFFDGENPDKDSIYLKNPVLNANIQLYPLGYGVPTYTVKVVYNGAPVRDALVFVNPVEPQNSSLTVGNFLTARSNRLEGFVVVTDENGVVDLPSANLVLGGAYSINVAPVELDDRILGLTEDRVIIVGSSVTTVTIPMSAVTPAPTDDLYIESTTNDDLKVKGSYSGLEITFSKPVEIISMWSCRISTFGGDSNNNGSYGILASDDYETSDVNEACDMELSSDGLKLTIFARFSDDGPVDPGDIGFGVRYQVSNGLRIKGGTGTTFSVGDDGSNKLQHAKYGSDTSYLRVTFF